LDWIELDPAVGGRRHFIGLVTAIADESKITLSLEAQTAKCERESGAKFS